MPFFKYRAVDIKGNKATGSFEAVDEAAVILMIKQKGLVPVEVSADHDFAHTMRKMNLTRVPVKDIAVFCRQFATILASGVTVLTAVDMLRRQTTNGRLRKAIELVYLDLLKGNTMSQSFRARGNVFPELMINMVASGEANGAMDYAMLRMAVHYEKESTVNQKIRAAMTYPAILAVISVFMVIFMVYFILPSFLPLIDKSAGELPKLTRMVVGTTEFLRIRWYYIVPAVIAIAGLFRYASRIESIRRLHHKLLLKLPVFGRLQKKIIASRFSRTVGILLASGIPLLSALESAKDIVRNSLAEEAIHESITAVRNGQGLAVHLQASGVFDPMVVRMVQIGEETGTLDEILTKTADFFDSEVEAGLGRMMQLIEPSMLIIMGAVVGTVVLAMLLPMYSMLGNIGV